MALASEQASPEDVVLDLPREGKAPALNAGVAASRGEVLVFTDDGARLQQLIDGLPEDCGPIQEPAAARALVQWTRSAGRPPELGDRSEQEAPGSG